MQQNLKLLAIFLSFFLTLAASSVFANSEFPGRAKYPTVKIISKSKLLSHFNNVVIVDARSKLEYETLKIKGSVHIPIAGKNFAKEIVALRATTKKTIVFYCNGRTCMKSYKAVKTAKKAKVKNIMAYDAGMFEWAETYPNYAELLGRSPVNKKDIISKQKFKAHNLNPEEFMNKIYELGNKSFVLDIRDKYQRGAAGFFPGKERWASLDDREKLDKYLKEAIKGNRSIFIYDEVGKQVRWLQYALEDANIKNYYFMNSGAKGYFKIIMREFGIQ